MLKLPQVAHRLGVSERTARRYIKAGTIPSVFIGNAYRVREEDVEEYMRQAQVTPGESETGKALSPQPDPEGAARIRIQGEVPERTQAPPDIAPSDSMAAMLAKSVAMSKEVDLWDRLAPIIWAVSEGSLTAEEGCEQVFLLVNPRT